MPRDLSRLADEIDELDNRRRVTAHGHLEDPWKNLLTHAVILNALALEHVAERLDRLIETTPA